MVRNSTETRDIRSNNNINNTTSCQQLDENTRELRRVSQVENTRELRRVSQVENTRELRLKIPGS